MTGAITVTITQPESVEPDPLRTPVTIKARDQRLDDAEHALMSARRNIVNALDWIERGLRDVRKARGERA